MTNTFSSLSFMEIDRGSSGSALNESGSMELNLELWDSAEPHVTQPSPMGLSHLFNFKLGLGQTQPSSMQLGPNRVGS